MEGESEGEGEGERWSHGAAEDEAEGEVEGEAEGEAEPEGKEECKASGNHTCDNVIEPQSLSELAIYEIHVTAIYVTVYSLIIVFILVRTSNYLFVIFNYRLESG